MIPVFYIRVILIIAYFRYDRKSMNIYEFELKAPTDGWAKREMWARNALVTYSDRLDKRFASYNNNKKNKIKKNSLHI